MFLKYQPPVFRWEGEMFRTTFIYRGSLVPAWATWDTVKLTAGMAVRCFKPLASIQDEKWMLTLSPSLLTLSLFQALWPFLFSQLPSLKVQGRGSSSSIHFTWNRLSLMFAEYYCCFQISLALLLSDSCRINPVEPIPPAQYSLISVLSHPPLLELTRT